MKEKIFLALKKAILVDGKTSVSDKTINAYVDVIAGQITEESQIASAIAPHVALLKEVQLNINAVAAGAVSAKEAGEARRKAEEAAGGGEEPEWKRAMKEMSEQIGSLTGIVSGMSAEKTRETLSRKLASALDAKGVPAGYYKPYLSGRALKDDAEVESLAEGIASGWGEAKQAIANDGFGGSVAPVSGGGATKEVDAIVGIINQGTKQMVEQQKI
jgi:hypothetical protein